MGWSYDPGSLSSLRLPLCLPALAPCWKVLVISSRPRPGQQMWKGLQFPGLRTQLPVVSRLQTGSVITDRKATQSLTKELSPVRCGVQTYSDFSVAKKKCVSKTKWVWKRTIPLSVFFKSALWGCWGLQERQCLELLPEGVKSLWMPLSFEDMLPLWPAACVLDVS